MRVRRRPTAATIIVTDEGLRTKHVTLRKKYKGEEYLLRRKIIAQQKIIFRLKNKLRVFQCMRRP